MPRDAEAEEQAMVAHLVEHGCPKCGNKPTAPKVQSVRYSDPLTWEFRCPECSSTLYVGYEAIGSDEIGISIPGRRF